MIEDCKIDSFLIYHFNVGLICAINHAVGFREDSQKLDQFANFSKPCEARGKEFLEQAIDRVRHVDHNGKKSAHHVTFHHLGYAWGCMMVAAWDLHKFDTNGFFSNLR